MRKLLTSIKQIAKFYGRCFVMAFRHSYGIADGIGFFLGIAAGIIIKIYPETATAMINLLWQIPMVAFALIYAVRLLLSPYWLYQEREAQALQSENTLQLESKGTEERLRLEAKTNTVNLESEIQALKDELASKTSQLEARHKQNDMLEQLSRFSRDGGRILKASVSSGTVNWTQLGEWEKEAEDFIKTYLGEPYATRLMSESGITRGCKKDCVNGHRPVESRLYYRRCYDQRIYSDQYRPH